MIRCSATRRVPLPSARMAFPERAPGPGIVPPLSEDVTLVKVEEDVTVLEVDTVVAKDNLELDAGNVLSNMVCSTEY